MLIHIICVFMLLILSTSAVHSASFLLITAWTVASEVTTIWHYTNVYIIIIIIITTLQKIYRELLWYLKPSNRLKYEQHIIVD